MGVYGNAYEVVGHAPGQDERYLAYRTWVRGWGAALISAERWLSGCGLDGAEVLVIQQEILSPYGRSDTRMQPTGRAWKLRSCRCWEEVDLACCWRPPAWPFDLVLDLSEDGHEQ